jgi:hypothetical protein
MRISRRQVIGLPGSRHHRSAGLLADILSGLDTANRVAYYAGRVEFDNW